MYSLLRNEPLRRQVASDAKAILTTQALTLLPALLITQLFYHWKSFLLEFAGFLVTWLVIDFVVSLLLDLWRKQRSPSSGGAG
jgi:type III secretory pathway component EscR